MLKKRFVLFFCTVLNKIRYVDCDVQVLYSDDGGGDGGSNNIGILFSAVFLNVCVCVMNL